MADKKTDDWNEGYRTAIAQVLEIISRVNIAPNLKSHFKTKIKKLRIELGMTEKKLSLDEI